MKKSDRRDYERMLKGLSAEERKEALQWIDSLSAKELEAFEDVDQVKRAQSLLEAFLKAKKKKSDQK